MLTTPDPRSGRESLITPTFILITLSTLAYFLTIGILLPTLPHFVNRSLGLGDLAVGIVVGSFAVSAVFLRTFFGGLGDRRGRRFLVVGGSAVVAGSVCLYAVSGTLWLIVLMRILTGVGHAAFYVGAASAIQDLAPHERRGEAFSLFSLALFLGLALGPVLGESVLVDAGFTAVWLLGGATALAASLIGLLTPETRQTRDAGAEARGRKLIHRAGLMPGTILATQIWGLAVFSTFIPLYSIEVGLSASGAVFATYSAVVLLIRSLGARIPDVVGPRRAAIGALGASAIGLCLIAGWGGVPGLFAGAAIWAVGQALSFPALMTLATSRAPAAERGAVVGTFTAFFDLSFGLGAVASGAVAALLGYRGAFLTASGVALLGMFLLRPWNTGA